MDASRDGVTVIKDNGILIEKDVPIPLADGHVIYCNVFRPNREGVVRPRDVFGGINTIHTGGNRSSYVLMPLVPVH
jgi:hypothetical protein